MNDFEGKKWDDFIMSMSNKVDKQVMREGFYLATDSGQGLAYWNSLMLNALVQQIKKGNLVLTNNNKEDLLDRVEISYTDSDRDYSLNKQTKIYIEQVLMNKEVTQWLIYYLRKYKNGQRLSGLIAAWLLLVVA